MQSPAQTINVPRAGLRFAAPVTLAAASDAAGRTFSGVAYGGGTITDHGWWDAVAFDLAGLSAMLPMPLLMQHDSERVIGVIDRFDNDGMRVEVAGRLFTGIDPDAAAVAAKADAGAPWQMSVGIFPDRIEQLPADGSGAVVNGRSVRAGATVFRSARVRETSFVALGADGSTYANVFDSSAAGEHVAQLVNQEPPMSDTADTDHAAQLAAITAERDAATARSTQLEADLSALREQFAARDRAERETAVRTLLGEEFSAETAAPYLDMSAVQFAAVQTALTAARSRLPQGFTAEQTPGGGKPAMTPEAVTKYRRDNPGATYEQAFAALKAA